MQINIESSGMTLFKNIKVNDLFVTKTGSLMIKIPVMICQGERSNAVEVGSSSGIVTRNFLENIEVRQVLSVDVKI